MKIYIHTIKNRPAYFDGRQIVYIRRYGKKPAAANSLKQIRREQELSRKFRISQGFSDDPNKYSYALYYFYKEPPIDG